MVVRALLRDNPGRLKPLLEEESGKRCGEEIGLAYNPEFLREGSAIRDYDTPAYTIIGTTDAVAEREVRGRSTRRCRRPVIVVEPAVAEMIKYVANAWHATKIVFANEVGRLAKAFGVDGRDVMEVIAGDTKLNVSSVYLRPGFAYGGSCLPKDVGALLAQARGRDVPVPLLASLPVSNAQQVELAFRAVLPPARGASGCSASPSSPTRTTCARARRCRS